jgi:hypothetical protein
MRRTLHTACAAVLLAAAAVVAANAQPAPASAGHDESFSSFLRKYEVAQNAFINGDASKWMPLVSHSAKTSIFGGFGGYEVGWKQIGPRYAWAAEQFRPSGAKNTYTYLVKQRSGDTAYYVALEQSHVLYVNGTEPVPQNLRATMIFRKEHGKWKIVHRHADFLAPTGPPPSN